MLTLCSSDWILSFWRGRGCVCIFVAPLALGTVPLVQEALQVCWSNMFSYTDLTHNSTLLYSIPSVVCLPYVLDLARGIRSSALTVPPRELENSKQWLVWVTKHFPLHKGQLSLLCFAQAKQSGLWQPLFSKWTIQVKFKIPYNIGNQHDDDTSARRRLNHGWNFMEDNCWLHYVLHFAYPLRWPLQK